MKKLKRILVVCDNPTSTLTKGKIYDALIIPEGEKRCKSEWGIIYYAEYQKAYRLRNDRGNIITVIASRFHEK